jgi:hypothetical protein
MPVDEFESRADTVELPPVEAGRIDSDTGVFSARARPVVLSGVELDLIDEADGEGPVVGPGGQPLAQPNQRRPSPIAHGAVVVILAIPAMLIVAFGIAVAAG